MILQHEHCDTMDSTLVRYYGYLQTQTQQPGVGDLVYTQGHTPEGDPVVGHSPVKLVTIAAAGCVMSMIGHAARVHDFDVEGMYTLVSHTMHAKPARIASVRLEIHIEGKSLGEKERKVIDLAARSCPVFASLSPEVEKELVFVY